MSVHPLLCCNTRPGTTAQSDTQNLSAPRRWAVQFFGPRMLPPDVASRGCKIRDPTSVDPTVRSSLSPHLGGKKQMNLSLVVIVIVTLGMLKTMEKTNGIQPPFLSTDWHHLGAECGGYGGMYLVLLLFGTQYTLSLNPATWSRLVSSRVCPVHPRSADMQCRPL